MKIDYKEVLNNVKCLYEGIFDVADEVNLLEGMRCLLKAVEKCPELLTEQLRTDISIKEEWLVEREYCPECGERLYADDNRLRCRNCSFEQYLD